MHQRKRLQIDDVELEELSSGTGDAGLERVELEELLRALPENYREPLLLQVLGGFSCREIAEMMSISEQNVMTRLTRSRQMLQRLAAPAPQAASSKGKG